MVQSDTHPGTLIECYTSRLLPLSGADLHLRTLEGVMWTWKPNYRQAFFDATFFTLFFVAMYGELRSGNPGLGTVFFIGMVWRYLDAKPPDYIERLPS